MRGAYTVTLVALCGSLLLSSCASRAPSGTTPQREVVTLAAISQVGKPYRYGGSGPDNFDCSGLVRYAYAQAGVALPRTAAEQSQLGRVIAIKDARPADLLFYRFDDDDVADHVVIYLGDNEGIHAPSKGHVVRTVKLDIPYFSRHFIGVHRVLD